MKLGELIAALQSVEKVCGAKAETDASSVCMDITFVRKKQSYGYDVGHEESYFVFVRKVPEQCANGSSQIDYA